MLIETVLAQVANGTTIIAAPTIFDQVETIAASISGIITIVGGLVIWGITRFRQVRKEQLTERDKWIIDNAKAVQIGAQKDVEILGRFKGLAQTLYEINIPESERKKLEEKLTPILQETSEQLKAAENQATMIKSKAVEVFGEAGDVDLDKSVPRESAEISAKLRSTANVNVAGT
jgi:hypothetical protein